jgi:hypothetical protein
MLVRRLGRSDLCVSKELMKEIDSIHDDMPNPR